jgi:hypothetical protein
MLLRAEDKSKFSARIDMDGPEFWASYSVTGQVKGEIVTQSDRRMFASEQEARSWLVGEAETRGFPDFQPDMRATA